MSNALDTAWAEVIAGLPTEAHLSGHVSLQVNWDTDNPEIGLSYSATFFPLDNITPQYFIGYQSISVRSASADGALKELALRMARFQPREVTMTPRTIRRDGREGWIWDVPWVRVLGRIVMPAGGEE